MRRVVQPEWLDELPPQDPRAIGSRVDLQRLNALMGHVRIVRRCLLSSSHAPRRFVELGAGDGTFMLRLAKALGPGFAGARVLLVDRQPLPSKRTKAEFQQIGWISKSVKADVFDWLNQRDPNDCIIANLFLHHFSEEKIAELFSLAAGQTDFMVACEPRRSRFSLVASHSLGAVGCNVVTRHDAPVSVRAGFADDELSRLWPSPRWKLREEAAGLFSHLFVAEKPR